MDVEDAFESIQCHSILSTCFTPEEREFWSEVDVTSNPHVAAENNKCGM